MKEAIKQADAFQITMLRVQKALLQELHSNFELGMNMDGYWEEEI